MSPFLAIMQGLGQVNQGHYLSRCLAQRRGKRRADAAARENVRTRLDRRAATCVLAAD